MEEGLNEEGENQREGEVSPALIAVHPLEKSVIVAIGSDLRAFDLQEDCAISLVDGSGGPPHSDSIRAISFGANGSLFASAGDDKLVKIWTTNPWNCIHTVSSEKRVTAVAISHDGLFVCFADKFGVVWAVGTDGNHEIKDKGSSIFAHYCSIITSLEFSPDGRFIVSADRDFKIRVTVFPKRPFNGAHEIQSFCLGHTEFVTCLSFVSTQEYPRGFLLSGSGDSTVRLWDITSGSLLDTCEVGHEAGILESKEAEETVGPAITDICASPNGAIVAVAIQSLHGIVLLTCNLSAQTLSVMKVVSMGGTCIPTSLSMSSSADRIWMVTGASNLPGLDSSMTRVRVISGLNKCVSDSNNDHKLVVAEDNEIPGGMKLLEKLQGGVSTANVEEALTSAAEAVKIAMRNLLIKKQYSVEKRELRKKSRNDKKLKS